MATTFFYDKKCKSISLFRDKVQVQVQVTVQQMTSSSVIVLHVNGFISSFLTTTSTEPKRHKELLKRPNKP